MIKIGLYGKNGHQLPVRLPDTLRAQVVAVADYPTDALVDAYGSAAGAQNAIRRYPDLDALLNDPEIDLISLCSFPRSVQAAHACQCLEAGKHVLAEKPAALSHSDLEAILATAARTGRIFREMADSFLEAPVRAMRTLVDAGALGEIVQVQTQKSYPWHPNRPQDMISDGGLTRQVGIHATRFIIGATGQPIVGVMGLATGLGNPGAGTIQIASAFTCTLSSGAVAAMHLNYLNPTNFGSWGNEHLRVFGTRGMVESVDGFRRHLVYLEGKEPLPLELPVALTATSYLGYLVTFLLDGTPMPIAWRDELAALRAILAAHEAASTGRFVTVPHAAGAQ